MFERLLVAIQKISASHRMSFEVIKKKLAKLVKIPKICGFCVKLVWVIRWGEEQIDNTTVVIPSKKIG